MKEPCSEYGCKKPGLFSCEREDAPDKERKVFCEDHFKEELVKYPLKEVKRL